MSDRTEAPLPEERIPPARWRDVAATVIGTVAFVLVCNTAVGWYLGRYTPNLGYRVIRTKWNEALDPAASFDWIVIGDSVAGSNIDPDVLKRAFGVSAHNYGTTGYLGVAGSVWMLDAYIERHGPPRVVILHHAYDVWRRRAAVGTMAQVPLPWGYWRSTKPPAPLTFGQECELWAGRHFHLYANGRTLRHLAANPDRLFDVDGAFTAAGMRINFPRPDEVRRDFRDHVRSLARRPRFRPSAQTEAALARLRALAERHGFDVYVPGPALYDELVREESFRSYYTGVRSFLEAEAAASPRIRFVLPDPTPFPRSSLDNCDHLAGAAPAAFTQALVDAIRTQQG